MAAGEQPDRDLLLAELVARLGGLSDWRQRAHACAELLTSLSPEDASAAFARLLGRAFALRGRRARVASSAARFAVARGEWPPEHLAHTREAAVAQGDRLTDVFLVTEPAPEFNDSQAAVPDYGGGRPLTLGERRAIALRPSRRTIELAMRDPHPLVATRLLGNPKLTEADVLRIASRRPAEAAVLREIGLSAKWRVRQRVAAALVQNPCAPPSIALSLLPDLEAQLVAAVAEDGNLAEAIRGAARALLEETADFRQPKP
jgi:hypothetical protein